MGGDGEQDTQDEPGGHGPQHVLRADPQAAAELGPTEDIGELAEPDEPLRRAGAVLLMQAEVDESVEGVEKNTPNTTSDGSSMP